MRGIMNKTGSLQKGAGKKRRLRKKNPLWLRILECIGLVALFLLYVFPFYWMIITSLKTAMEAIATQPVFWPRVLHFENYPAAWAFAGFLKYGKNSLIISVVCTAVQLLVCVPSAFAFARMKFRGSKLFFAMLMLDMMTPKQCVFLPIFIMFTKMNLLNTYRSMIYIFSYSASVIFFLRNAFKQVSNEVLEAARLDGAMELTVMFRITLPMVKPVIVTQTLFCFLARWNDYFWNLTMTTNDNIKTLPRAINALANIELNLVPQYQVIMAGTTMLMAPMLIAYVFANRQIKNAFVYSGIK